MLVCKKMVVNDNTEIIQQISSTFEKYIIHENGSVRIIKEPIAKLFDFILKNFVFLDASISTVNRLDDRNLLYRRLNWLYSKLLIIRVNDDGSSLSIKIRTLLDLMIQRSLSCFMYWFDSFVNCQLQYLKEAVKQDLQKDALTIEVPGSEIEGNLEFSETSIKSETQMDNFVSFIFQTLSRAVDVFPLCMRTLNFEMPEIVMQVLLNRSMECKSAVLLFCVSYYHNSDTVEVFDVSIQLFQHMAMIYENLNEYIESKIICLQYFLDIFLKSYHRFLENLISYIKHLSCSLNPITFERLVASMSQLMFFESRWSTKYKLPLLTHWYIDILDVLFLNHNYEDSIIKHIDILKELCPSNSNMLHILKYKIVLEIESGDNFVNKVSQLSETWKEIQRDLAKETNYILNNQQISNEDFLTHLEWIKEAIQITADVEFHVTRRHQMSHCLNFICKYSGSPKNGNISNMYKFSDWDYDHINLDFFDDLSSITHKLTLAVSKRTDFTPDIMIVLIKVSAMILQIPSTAAIKEDKKLSLLSMLIMPFIPSFESFENVSKSAEFVKILSHLSTKLKECIAKFSLDKALKYQSIHGIVQLKFKELGKSFEWMNLNLMQLIFKKEEIDIQRTYANKFLNLLMANSETMSTYLLHYQNIRLKNTNVEFHELKDILCLHDKHVTILKTIKSEYHVYCSACTNEEDCDNDRERRWRQLIVSKKACIISADYIDKKEVRINIQQNLSKLSEKSTSFIASFIKNIPACFRHAKSFSEFIKTRQFLEMIFTRNQEILAQTDYCLRDIILCIQDSQLEEPVKTNFFEHMLAMLFNLTTHYSRQSPNMKIQFHIVNMIATFGMNARSGVCSKGSTLISDTDRVSLKCFKMLMYFIILKDSEVKGVAVNSLHRMLENNGLSAQSFIDWYKVNILELVTQMCLLSSLEDPNYATFFNAIVNTLNHLNYPDIQRFLKKNIDITLSTIIIFCIQNKKMQYVNALIEQSGYSNEEALTYSCLSIYEKFYKLDRKNREYCMEFIYSHMKVSMKAIFQQSRKNILQDVLIRFSLNPVFVTDVVRLCGDENIVLTDDEDVANYIAGEFSGVLNNFEMILNSSDSEKPAKQAILKSLGDLIRFLGGRRISNLCFKIMSLLRTIVSMKQTRLRELSLSVWKILIFNCDISSLGPFLSQILVALENYIVDFPKAVEEICEYLVFQNSNLLSTHVSDLFFIEKTSFDQSIKSAILNQIESQRLGDENEFDVNLHLMIRHLKNEHADSNVKIYCLQYLEDFIKRNRKKFNNLIFGATGMDGSVKYLLNVLATCSKSFHNKMLQIQTSKCFGELGALKPALNKQHYLSKKIDAGEMTVHSDEFALKILRVYCIYYKDMKDANHVQRMALAIQAILKERNVNRQHYIWKSLPEFTQELFKPLLTSCYSAKEVSKTKKNETIFWHQAQKTTYWAYLLAGILIEAIDVEETKHLLLNLLPSMRENQEISSILLPRIILHYFQSNKSQELDENIFIEFELVFKMVLDSTVCSDASKGELEYKFVPSYDYTPIERKEIESTNNVLSVSVKTAKMIFDVYDFLVRYIQVSDKPQLTERITNLLNRFSKKTLAEVNFKCEEYERAMILFEAYFKTLDKSTQEMELPFLVNIYAKLRDADLIEGVKTLRVTDWSLADKIFISEITGNLEGTFSYIEMMLKQTHFTKEQIQTIINCYIQSNQNSTALLVADQLLNKLYESNREIPFCDEIKSEALWRLSRFDELDELLASERVSDRNDWNVVCSQLLSTFRRSDDESFWDALKNARIAVMHNFKLSDTEEAIYEDNYNEIFHLHLLTDMEKFQKAFEVIQSNRSLIDIMKTLKNLIKELDSRKSLLQTSSAVIELSLSLRRVLLLQFKTKLLSVLNDDTYSQASRFIEHEVGKTWIECAKIACAQNMFSQAHAYMMEADIYKPQELFIEKAKYYWMKDDKAMALRVLELNCSELEKFIKTNKKASVEKTEKMFLLSRARLDIARYNAEVKNVDFETNKELYKNALLDDSIEILQCSQNEEIYVLLAEYMDQHYFSKASTEKLSHEKQLESYEKQLEIMEAYGSSMKYGMSYVLQSMPRFLQIWFDVMATLDEKSNKKSRSEEEMELKINTYVKGLVKSIKPYYFYTAFSQLISRLCHRSRGVFSILKIIIQKLIDEYPHESMWFIMPNTASKDDVRKTRAKEILESFSKQKTAFGRFTAVMEKIMQLAQRQVVDQDFMASFCSSLERLLRNSAILMPLQTHLVVQPSPETFHHSQLLIQGLSREIEIMRSLQKPKKITFIGSDGREYPMLLKFKDDLRIDFRVMEFLKVINDYFNKDSDASQRCLKARTYSVIPWSEDMGIIEWVPNLNTFKNVVYDQYKKAKTKVPQSSEVKRLFEQWQVTDDKMKFFDEMKIKYPPILGQWYLEQFPNVQSYFSARQNYIRSVAVMSMVGYIMGLGDRHMENLLFDIHSGEVVHVDFNCVFNKGESLGYPETVPFRLTQHMIEAMGPLGIEGPFRKCCEVALKLMQREKNTLVSYLRPFIYDPMIRKKALLGAHAEAVDSIAMGHLEKVEKKLDGIVKKYKGTSGIALSSEGQVKFIIDEAKSNENLSVMYFHWSPFM